MKNKYNYPIQIALVLKGKYNLQRCLKESQDFKFEASFRELPVLALFYKYETLDTMTQDDSPKVLKLSEGKSKTKSSDSQGLDLAVMLHS